MTHFLDSDVSQALTAMTLEHTLANSKASKQKGKEIATPSGPPSSSTFAPRRGRTSLTDTKRNFPGRSHHLSDKYKYSMKGPYSRGLSLQAKEFKNLLNETASTGSGSIELDDNINPGSMMCVMDLLAGGSLSLTFNEDEDDGTTAITYFK